MKADKIRAMTSDAISIAPDRSLTNARPAVELQGGCSSHTPPFLHLERHIGSSEQQLSIPAPFTRRPSDGHLNGISRGSNNAILLRNDWRPMSL